MHLCMVSNRSALGSLFHKLCIVQRDDHRSYHFVIVEQMSLCTAEIPTAISALAGNTKSAKRQSV